MARNLFATGDDRTTISDSEKLAAGAGTSNAFNITWAAFKDLILTFLGTQSTSGTVGGNAYTDYDNLNSTRTRVITGDSGTGVVAAHGIALSITTIVRYSCYIQEVGNIWESNNGQSGRFFIFKLNTKKI